MEWIELHLKGIEKWQEKLPAYPGKKLALLPLGAIIVAILGYSFFIILDIMPRVFDNIPLLVALEPYLPILGSVFIAWLALWLVWGLWNKRDEMKEKYGELAYQKMFPRGLSGIFLVFSIPIHAFTSIRSLPPSVPANDLTIQWSRSLFPLLGVSPEIEIWIRVILSGLFLLLALLTVRSAIFTFGIDYMAVVYLYFPEESEIQEHEIYSVIRHPTYLGGFLIGFSAIFFRFSVYSIFIGLLLCLVFRLQAWKEEKELVERFGEGYSEYQKNVPGFIPRPGRIRAYLKFLRKAV